MAESGTDYLKAMKARAASDKLELLGITTFLVAAATMVVTIALANIQDWALDPVHLMTLMLAAGAVWLICANALVNMVLSSYQQHYLHLLLNRGLLLQLLDNEKTESFSRRSAAFMRSYQRIALSMGEKPYPRKWRIPAIALLAAAWFLTLTLLALTAQWMVSFANQMVLSTSQTIWIACLCVGLYVVEFTIDRPRQIALRVALALALLRDQEQ